MDSNQFGVLLKQRRAELKLTLKEASRRSGIQPSRLHDLEQGRNSTTGKPTAPTAGNIRQIAQAYGLEETYLWDAAGRPRLAVENDAERRLLAHFCALTPGHQAAVLALVDSLYQLDRTR